MYPGSSGIMIAAMIYAISPLPPARVNITHARQITVGSTSK